mgnify:FL=1
MGLFSSIWEGIKSIGNGILEIEAAVAEVLLDVTFWLVEKVFDAIEAVAGWIDNIFDQLGDWLSGSKGEVIILPPTPEVEKVVEDLEKNGKVHTAKTYHRNKDKGTLGVIKSGNQVKGIQFIGSEKGFGEDIKKHLNKGNLYKVPVED